MGSPAEPVRIGTPPADKPGGGGGYDARLGDVPAADRVLVPPRAGLWLGVVCCSVGAAAVALALSTPAAMGAGAFYVLGFFAVLGLGLSGALVAGLLQMDMRGRLAAAQLAAGLAETSAVALAVTNNRGRIVYCNHAFRALAGGKKRRGMEAILSGSGGDEAAARAFRVSRAARAGIDAREDITLQNADGVSRLVTVRVERLLPALAPGTVGQPYAVWRIADQTASHEKLEASEREAGRLESYLNGLVSGLCTLDQQGRVLYLNDTLAGWIGVDAATVTAGSLAFDSLLAGPRVPLGKRTGDVRVCDADLKPRSTGSEGGPDDIAGGGPVVPVRIVERDGVMADGRKVRFLAMHDRRGGTGGDALDAAEVRFAHFFNNAPIGIVTVNGEGQVVSVNRAFRDLAGDAATDTVIGSTGERLGLLSDLVAYEDRAAFDLAILDAVNGKPSCGPVDVRLLPPVAADGRREDSSDQDKVLQAYISRAGAAIEDNGEPARSEARVMVYFVDLTEQKTLEVQFAQSQKMQAVGQLAGGVAHDFNNLLTAIIGFCDLLFVRHQPGDPSFADVMQIKQNANRAANLVRQLLAFSRQQTLRPTVLNPTDALADLSNLLRRLLGETVDLKMVHGRDLWTIKADQNQFEQVIINLAVNARDAMLEADASGSIGGELTIRTANVGPADIAALDHPIMPAAEYVLIEVSDTGCGIAKEDLGKIFEPFFTTKEVGKGTGLGLSTVYGIIKQTGGYIFPVSQVGVGTTFRIFIPRHIEVEKPKPEIAEAPPKAVDLSGKGTVLLVEDEDAVRSFAARALQTRGYTVLEAASGEHALEVLDEFDGDLDVVVSDVVMPNMDGPTLIRELNERKPGLKIIFVSGYAEDAFRRNLDKTITFEFLPKPFSLKQLAAKVKDVIERD